VSASLIEFFAYFLDLVNNYIGLLISEFLSIRKFMLKAHLTLNKMQIYNNISINNRVFISIDKTGERIKEKGNNVKYIHYRETVFPSSLEKKSGGVAHIQKKCIFAASF